MPRIVLKIVIAGAVDMVQVGLDLCYEKLILIFDIEKIALFFIFEVQKMIFHSLDLNPSGGAGHERGSTHSVQSLLNLDNINAQWDILTEYKSY